MKTKAALIILTMLSFVVVSLLVGVAVSAQPFESVATYLTVVAGAAFGVLIYNRLTGGAQE